MPKRHSDTAGHRPFELHARPLLSIADDHVEVLGRVSDGFLLRLLRGEPLLLLLLYLGLLRFLACLQLPFLRCSSDGFRYDGGIIA